MSHYIVLVKQVPDVSQITDNAFDPKTGNLIRTRLPSVINELDAQALAFANRMKQLSGDTDSKIIVLTMGPPMAADVLRYSLSRCAEGAVLLTDRALGGADTWATANPLAFACRRIVTEMFGGDEDYYIIAGMQSVDGDTAQVPAQLAEELQIPCIAYATDAAYSDGKFQFTRIISGGSQVVEAKKKPTVITVAKYEYPLYATFAATRKANNFELITWGADDVKATAIGVKGSKTRVIRVFPPGKTTRKCQEISDVKELAKLIAQNAKGSADATQSDVEDKKYILPSKRESVFDRTFEGTDKENGDFNALLNELNQLNITHPDMIDESIKEKILASDNISFHTKAFDDMISAYNHVEPSYKGQVWVMAEHDKHQVNTATYELLGKAKDLADALDTKTGVILAGNQVESMAQGLIEGGADVVYLIEDPLLDDFDPYSYRKVVSDVITKYKPQIVLYGATPQGRVLAPMVSYRVGCGLTADCTGLDIKDSSRKGQIATLFQTRPALGGNIMATICTKDSDCQMATARPGVMKRLPVDPSRTGNIIREPADITHDDISLNIVSTELGSGSVNFDADVIVAGGKGMLNRDSFENLTGALCKAIQEKAGTSVERGATRSAVEQGFTERVHQVGQTGTAVGPKLYVAIGISGAIQHMIGVANTETIIAVNSDPNAPIFKQCDYYIVGTADQIVPQLVEELKSA